MSKGRALSILFDAADVIPAAYQALERVRWLKLCQDPMTLLEAQYLLRGPFRRGPVSSVGGRWLFLDLRDEKGFDPEPYDKANGGPGAAAAALEAYVQVRTQANTAPTGKIDIYLGEWAKDGDQITCNAEMTVGGGEVMFVDRIVIGRADGKGFWVSLDNAVYGERVVPYQFEYALGFILTMPVVIERLEAYLKTGGKLKWQHGGPYDQPTRPPVLEEPEPDPNMWVNPVNFPQRWLIDGLISAHKAGIAGLKGFGWSRCKQLIGTWVQAAGLGEWYYHPCAELDGKTPAFYAEHSPDPEKVVPALARLLMPELA
jgi:hypothetical protein